MIRMRLKKIVEALDPSLGFTQVLEVGPGMGVLSDFLLEKKGIRDLAYRH